MCTKWAQWPSPCHAAPFNRLVGKAGGWLGCGLFVTPGHLRVPQCRWRARRRPASSSSMRWTPSAARASTMARVRPYGACNAPRRRCAHGQVQGLARPCVVPSAVGPAVCEGARGTRQGVSLQILQAHGDPGTAQRATAAQAHAALGRRPPRQRAPRAVDGAEGAAGGSRGQRAPRAADGGAARRRRQRGAADHAGDRQPAGRLRLARQHQGARAAPPPRSTSPAAMLAGRRAAPSRRARTCRTAACSPWRGARAGLPARRPRMRCGRVMMARDWPRAPSAATGPVGPGRSGTHAGCEGAESSPYPSPIAGADGDQPAGHAGPGAAAAGAPGPQGRVRPARPGEPHADLPDPHAHHELRARHPLRAAVQARRARPARAARTPPRRSRRRLRAPELVRRCTQPRVGQGWAACVPGPRMPPEVPGSRARAPRGGGPCRCCAPGAARRPGARCGRLCPNATGADIRSVCTEAGMFAIRARRKTVTEKDFLDAVNKVGANT